MEITVNRAVFSMLIHVSHVDAVACLRRRIVLIDYFDSRPDRTIYSFTSPDDILYKPTLDCVPA